MIKCSSLLAFATSLAPILATILAPILATMLAPILVTTLAFTPAASAHSESPLARKVQGFDDGGWVLRTNFGVISSDAPDRFVCEEAFLGGDRFFVAPIGPTTWVTFGDTTIHRTEDGCEFEQVATLASRVEDVDVDPASGSVVYVSNGEGAGVFYSGDSGQSFAPVGQLDTATHQITTVRFLDAETVLVGSYIRGRDGLANIVAINVDTDETTALELPADLTFPYLVAAGAGRLIFTARAMVQTVYVGTVDEPTLHARPQVAGETWPTGGAIAADGRLFLTGLVLGRGVEYADWNETELTWDRMLEQAPTGCVDARDGGSLVCSSSTGEGGEGDLVALSPDDSAMPLVVFENIKGPRSSCPEDSDVATVCPLVWPELAPALGAEIDSSELPDAGLPDDDTGPSDPSNTDEAGCAAVDGDANLLALIALAGWLVGRRPSKRRQRS